MPVSTNTRAPRARPSVRQITALTREAKAAAKKGSARAEALIALILRRKARIVEDFYDIGEALRSLQHDKLFTPLGYESFEELVEARGLMSHAQAYKLVAVVSSYTRDQALSLGLEKAFAVLTYAAATPSHQVPQLVLTEGINGKPVSTLSVRDIHARATALREASGKARKPSAAVRHANEVAAAWQQTLRASGLSSAHVSVHQVEGRIVVDARIGVDSLEAALSSKKKRHR